ncbi:MAG: murein L,D-transpeptidase [Alphaproteobacteria bacterium]|nr:murein L,D-transpeptidase [Alphaproteobacteria bacterium]
MGFQVTKQIKKSTHLVSRRAVALGVATAPVALAAAHAQGGRDNPFRSQAEWSPGFDADSRLRVPRATTPLLSPQTVSATEQAIIQYRQLAASGGWNTVPGGRTLKLGTRAPAVAALRQRLTVTGDLARSAGNSPVFDSYVEAGVRRFQTRHGINPTGVVGKETFTALNVPVQERLRQLELNVVRLKSFSGDLGSRYVALNIPAAALEAVENGEIVSHHMAGVGKIDRQSPVMQALARDVNFNPFWTVPASIIRKDLIPKMQKEPSYLTDNKIRIFNRQGQEIQPSTVNWNSMEATQYMFRQDPGGDVNSLGFIRINVANPHGVYIHDTPAKGIFGDDYRFVSSGCVRVQNVRDLASWLLKGAGDGGWNRDRIDEVIRSGKRVDVKMAQNVNTYWVYMTAWADRDVIHFRDDIYRRDGISRGPAVAQSPNPVQPAADAEQADLPPAGLPQGGVQQRPLRPINYR